MPNSDKKGALLGLIEVGEICGQLSVECVVLEQYVQGL